MPSTCSRVAGITALTVWLVVPTFAQPPRPIQPDWGRLASGQGAQVFNRSVTVAREGDRTVARLDAPMGDGGAWLNGVQLGDGVIEVSSC